MTEYSRDVDDDGNNVPYKDKLERAAELVASDYQAGGNLDPAKLWPELMSHGICCDQMRAKIVALENKLKFDRTYKGDAILFRAERDKLRAKIVELEAELRDFRDVDEANRTLADRCEQLHANTNEAAACVNPELMLACSAPECPSWFEPTIRPKPKPEYKRDHLVNLDEINAWEADWLRERMRQWPWAYARMVLSARHLLPGTTPGRCETQEAP